ncbi:MAG TPA: hypothetical protein VIL01_15785 [Thermomicrobiales bacterium]
MVRMQRAAIAVLFAIGLLAIGGARATAQENAGAGASTIVTRVFVCPVAYTGSDFAGDCEPESGIGITVALDETEFAVSDTTGADGTIGFQGLGEGAYTITVDIPGDFADFVTYCGAPGEIEPRPLRGANTNQIGVDVRADEELTCSFYVIPVDARGEPTAEPELPGTGVPGAPADGLADEWLILGLLTAIASVVTGILLLTRRQLS